MSNQIIEPARQREFLQRTLDTDIGLPGSDLAAFSTNLQELAISARQSEGSPRTELVELLFDQIGLLLVAQEKKLEGASKSENQLLALTAFAAFNIAGLDLINLGELVAIKHQGERLEVLNRYGNLILELALVPNEIPALNLMAMAALKLIEFDLGPHYSRVWSALGQDYFTINSVEPLIVPGTGLSFLNLGMRHILLFPEDDFLSRSAHFVNLCRAHADLSKSVFEGKREQLTEDDPLLPIHTTLRGTDNMAVGRAIRYLAEANVLVESYGAVGELLFEGILSHLQRPNRLELRDLIHAVPSVSTSPKALALLHELYARHNNPQQPGADLILSKIADGIAALHRNRLRIQAQS